MLKRKLSFEESVENKKMKMLESEQSKIIVMKATKKIQKHAICIIHSTTPSVHNNSTSIVNSPILWRLQVNLHFTSGRSILALQLLKPSERNS